MAAISTPLQVLKTKILALFSPKSGVGEAASPGKTQLAIQIVGFVILILVGFWVITQVKVNGPIYKQLTESTKLRGDISPPSLFTINSFAALENIAKAVLAAGGYTSTL